MKNIFRIKNTSAIGNIQTLKNDLYCQICVARFGNRVNSKFDEYYHK